MKSDDQLRHRHWWYDWFDSDFRDSDDITSSDFYESVKDKRVRKSHPYWGNLRRIIRRLVILVFKFEHIGYGCLFVDLLSPNHVSVVGGDFFFLYY